MPRTRGDVGGKGQKRKGDTGGGHGKVLGQERRRRGRTNKDGQCDRRPDVERVRDFGDNNSGRRQQGSGRGRGGSPGQREELSRRGSQTAAEDPGLDWKGWRREPGCSCRRGGDSFVVEPGCGGGEAVRDGEGEGPPSDTHTHTTRGTRGVGVAYLRGAPRRRCGRAGSGCRHRRLSSSGRSRAPWAACASLTAAAAAAPGPSCGAAPGPA